MGVFSRFKDIVNSNINAILDKAEDPEKMLRLMMQEMEDTLIEMKSTCAAKMAQSVRLNAKLRENDALVNRWQQRAELAVQKGFDSLAREALIEKKNAVAATARQKEELDALDEIIAQSKKDIHQLEDKLEQSRAKLKLLQQKARKAEEERRMQSSMHYESEARFDSLAEKIDRLNAENELNKPAKTLDDKFRDMEASDEIEKELNELKKKEGIVK
jgi:Phage shock protein A (IM30), suppresses sigma54-dependent transcription